MKSSSIFEVVDEENKKKKLIIVAITLSFKLHVVAILAFKYAKRKFEQILSVLSSSWSWVAHYKSQLFKSSQVHNSVKNVCVRERMRYGVLERVH